MQRWRHSLTTVPAPSWSTTPPTPAAPCSLTTTCGPSSPWLTSTKGTNRHRHRRARIVFTETPARRHSPVPASLNSPLRYKLLIISDEIYGTMTFTGHIFTPIAALTTTVPVISVGGYVWPGGGKAVGKFIG